MSKIKNSESQIKVNRIIFSNKLIKIAPWLFENANKQILETIHGVKYCINIKKDQMMGWTRFYIKFPLTMFHGLSTILLTPKKAIYFFEMRSQKQPILMNGAYKKYINALKKECISARLYLKSKGVEIDMADPKTVDLLMAC